MGHRIVAAQRETADAIRDAQNLARDEAFKTQMSQLALEAAILAVAASAQKSAADIAAAAGSSATSAAQYDTFRQRLVDLANQSDGPTKEAILRLITQLDAVKSPPPVMVTADTSQAQSAVQQLHDQLAGLGLGTVPGVAPLVGLTALLGRLPRREHGGSVTARYPYIVGEKRAELFVPEVNGTILPSVPGANPGKWVVNSNISVADHLSSFMQVQLERRVEAATRRGIQNAAWDMA